MKDSYIIYRGKKIDLTEEQIKLLGLNIENVFKIANYNDNYFYISSIGDVKNTNNMYRYMDYIRYKIANYCLNKKIMTKRAKDEVLNRLLWRFSMENGWDDKLWEYDTVIKYNIFYDYNYKEYRVDGVYCGKYITDVYFVSKDIAQRAIDEIVIPFEKGEFPICNILE